MPPSSGSAGEDWRLRRRRRRGATSQQQLTAGDGYVQFTVGETNTFWLAGLGHDDEGTGYADIDFAFRFNGAGSADVLENGVYAGGDTPYAAGDVLRVAIRRRPRPALQERNVSARAPGLPRIRCCLRSPSEVSARRSATPCSASRLHHRLALAIENSRSPALRP